MTWTLIRKELRQHWLAVLLLGLGTMLGYGMIIAATLTKGQAGSGFEVLRLFLALMGPLSAVLLCHRLVVLEYQSRTQLFLEGLPLARWRMVFVKYSLGFLVILLLVLLAFGLACVLSWRRENLTARFLGIISVRTISVTWLMYSFCFLLGLLGRYRVPLYLATFLALGLLAEQTQFQVSHFGPCALLDNRFAYEGEVYPWSALRITWVLGSGFMALIVVLSLIREGSVAALLAEKMSHREKVFIAALLFGLLQAAGLLGEKTKKVPFDLNDAIAEQRRGVLVKVAATPGENKRGAQELASHIANELAGAREYLGLQALPTVFITRRSDLDANRYERGELEGNEGVHVRANFEAKDWNPEHFEAWLLREVLIVSSRERTELESRRWVLDGFPLFWITRKHLQDNLASDRQPALRALYGTESGFSSRDLEKWLSFREKVGDEVAAGVAWSGLRTLARREGPDACQRVLRRVLGIRPSKDIRASFEQVASVDTILRREAATSLPPFFGQWQVELAQARQTLADGFKQLPHLRGEVSFIRLSQDSRKIRYHAIIDPPPTAGTRYSFLYSSLSAFDEEVDPKSIQHEQNNYVEGAQEELPETLSRGGRLYWSFALQVPELGCQAISGWQRQEIQ
jgi:hypothetical protein